MNIKKQAISGVKWTTVSTVILAVTAILKISILTRFLDKSDFGLMALVMFVLGFMNLFMDMGLTSAILHKQGITKNEYASLYWLNFGFSFLLFGLVIIISPFVADFYNEQELTKLIPLMGLSLIISAIGRQFKTIQQKELKFKTIAFVESFISLLSLGMATYLAINNYGVYSLVYSALLQYIISNIIYLILGVKDVGLKIHFKYLDTKPFLSIGIYQVGGQIINFFNRDIDTLIIGKYFGAEILGGYNLAKQLVFRPSQVINPMITKVASPVLAKFQTDKLTLKNNYLKLVSIISTINIPVYIGLIIFAPIAVRMLYGEGFDNIVNLVRVLSVYMMFRAISNPIGSLVIATGRTELEFKWNLFTFFIMPIAIVTGAQFSIEAVTWTITITMIMLFVPSWWLLVREIIDVSLLTYVKAVFPILNLIKSVVSK